MIEELYADHYQELLRYCQALTDAWAAAEDLVQETYLRAMTHLEDIRDLNRRQQRSWLYKTARNLHIDRIRKQAREVYGADDSAARTPFEEDFTQIAVRQLVDRLPEQERGLFSMRYFEGYNATELGEIFHLTPSTVRGRLASAKKRIQKWCQEI